MKSDFFIQKREEHFGNFSVKLKNKRSKFVSWLLTNNWNPDVMFFEMYPYENGVIKNNERIPQYPKDYTYCNTRKKLLSETRAEIDSLDFGKATQILTTICKELIKRDFHFAIFHAEGQRSPHIIIYDFDELKNLKPHQREKAQLEFWRSLSPFEFQHLDRSIWTEDHFVPLEFSPHWKYGTPFDLLFEWIPKKREQCKV